MAIIKRGLGKGLSALIPESQETATKSGLLSGKMILSIEIQRIVPNTFQPRRDMDENIDDLSASIAENGILEPVLVRPHGDQFELIAGERRWRASQRAGLTHIPAILKDVDDEKALEIALVENLQREDLNPMDEAEAYAKLSDQFGLTQEVIAARVGKSRSTVANTVRLTSLPETIKEAIRTQQLTASHARSILAETDPQKQIEMARDIIENKMTVRDVEVMTAADGLEAGPAAPHRRKKKARRMAPELEIVAEALMEKLGTRVHIHG